MNTQENQSNSEAERGEENREPYISIELSRVIKAVVGGLLGILDRVEYVHRHHRLSNKNKKAIVHRNAVIEFPK